MKGKSKVLMLMLLAVVCIGCAPPSFVRTMEPTWASVELRKDVEYEKAWAIVIDLLTKRFDIAILSKDDGYARTAWLYTWTGDLTNDYRVRTTVKFAPDHKVVNFKSEAEYRKQWMGWVQGTDTRLLATLKSDIMGVVGRTTR